VLVAQRTFAHICQLDGALGACVHKPVAAGGVELGSCDDFGQFFHVCRFDIDNVEALILDVEVPEVDPKVVTADERFPIAVYRYAVDMVGVCVGVGLARYGRNDGVVVCESRKLQIGSSAKLRIRVPNRTASTSNPATRCQFVREIVLSHYLKRLFEHLPQLDRLVVRREEVVRGILSAAPFDLVDLFFDLERFEVIEFRLVRLELGVEFVLAGFFLLVLVCYREAQHEAGRTVSFLSNNTTRPPLSPVAR
jgi:hypothetical protein